MDEEELNIIQLAFLKKNIYFVARLIELFPNVLNTIYLNKTILSEAMRLSSFEIFVYVFEKV